MKRLFASLAVLTVCGWITIPSPARALDLPAGYQASIRPDPFGRATPVSVGLFIVDISSINDVQQSFTADLYFTVRWWDPRLADPGAEKDRVFALDEIWNPRLGIINRRKIEAMLPEVVRVAPDGSAVYSQRVFGDFHAPLDLRKFPADSQLLPLEILSYWYGPNELEISSDSSSTGTYAQFSLPGWIIESDTIEFVPEKVDGKSRQLEQVSWQLVAERRQSYYLYNLIIPLVLIALMAWCVFWIDPTYLPSQIAISTSSVFTLIAFRFSLRLFLPRVSYMTRADIFTLGMTALVFCALAQAVSTGWLAKNGKEALARRMDRWGRWAYLAGLLIILFATIKL